MAKSKRQPPNRAGGTGSKKAAPKAGERKQRTTQAERWEAERRARRRRALRIRGAAIALTILVVGAVVAWQVTSRRAAQRTIASFTTGSCEYDTRSDSGRVNEHSRSPSFAVDPPSGGVHDPGAARAGTFTAESAPPDGQIVHALEHGLVAIWYRPDLPAGDVEDLRAIRDAHSDDVLIIPRASLETPVAATAWHRRLVCERPEPESLAEFVGAYVGKGPENVPDQ